LNTTASILKIYVNEKKNKHGKSEHLRILEEAQKFGIVGASVYKGVEGYGRNNVIHTQRIVDVVESLPMFIEIIESTEKIDSFVESLRQNFSGLHIAIIDGVRLVKF
jgi:uncharacterized protein